MTSGMGRWRSAAVAVVPAIAFSMAAAAIGVEESTAHPYPVRQPAESSPADGRCDAATLLRSRESTADPGAEAAKARLVGDNSTQDEWLRVELEARPGLLIETAQQIAELRQRELQERWLWFVLAAVGLALAGSALLLIRLRRSQQAIRQLNAELAQRVEAATSELRQQASYLRALVDTLPLMVWLKDTDGRYLVVNQSIAEACGRPVTEMEGRIDPSSWPLGMSEMLQAEDDTVLHMRERTVTETRLPTGAWVEVYKAPVLDHEHNRVIGLVGAAHDISARKAAEQAREQALAEARRLAQQRSDFLAQMSHELRTPLNGILGFAQILRRDKPLTERQQRGLGIIEQSGQHLLALINDILDLARIDAAKVELEPAEMDLPGFLTVVSDIVRVKAEEKHVLFTHRFDKRLPALVKADEKRVRQVLLNLLSNAIKFTDRGEVSLNVELLREDERGARLRFEVLDTGIGMNDEQLGRLFQPFEQVAHGQRREGGTGLGLAISRRLVRLMGGDIEVVSKPGEGSRFWFDIELPKGRALAAAHRQVGMPVAYEGRRRKVLVVDDVAQNRAMLADGLAVLGFEVHQARNGAEGVEKALALRPDLMIVDVVMPVMDGLEATRRIRRIPVLQSLPIVATSGNNGQQVEAQSRAAGADAFIPKPIEQATLVATVGRLLDLNWVVEEPAEAHEDAAKWDEADFPVPPQEQTEALYRMARMGYMRRVRDQAERLAQLDPRYTGLSRRLIALAEACESKALVRLIERLRVPAGEADAR
ncbi:MAG TPA: ATP-binding protein [Burkholderiaceae bacterium]|nr:ATP-binding protein [Burkholderiaceae bacterium]